MHGGEVGQVDEKGGVKCEVEEGDEFVGEVKFKSGRDLL